MSAEDISELVDSHCHLNLPAFDEDRDQVIDKARRNGIKQIIIPGIDIETSKTAIECSKKYTGISAAVGVHPNSGKSWTKKSILEIKQLASDEKVVAIGEIGLDYYHDFCPRELQKQILASQLELAAELELPVIIHLRDSVSDLTHILETWHEQLVKAGSQLADKPGVLHSFSSSLETAQAMAQRHFKLGIGGPVTFHNAKNLQATVTELPVETLLIETDAPYLAPHPYRGQRNEPSNVRIVAEKIARLKGTTIEQIAEITSRGADKLFNWRRSH